MTSTQTSDSELARDNQSAIFQTAVIVTGNTFLVACVIALLGFGYDVPRSPPGVFLSLEVAAIGLGIATAFPEFGGTLWSFLAGEQYQPSRPMRRWAALRGSMQGAIVYILTLLVMVALVALVIDTGLAIKSPFVPLVIAPAVLGPFVARRRATIIGLLVTVTAALGVIAAFAPASECGLAECSVARAQQYSPKVGTYLFAYASLLLMVGYVAGARLESESRLRGTVMELRARLKEWEPDEPASGLQAAIRAGLERDVAISAAELPARPAVSRAALAEYVDKRPDAAIRLTADGERIEWEHPELVRTAQRLVDRFSAETAARLLADSLGLRAIATLAGEGDGESAVLAGTLASDPILPAELVIAARATVDHESLRGTARVARQNVPGATIAVLVVADASEWFAQPTPLRAQRSSATSVVVLDTARLFSVVGSIRPRDSLVGEVLEQADLSKANPFISTGATPPEMFFGREQEAAELLSILGASSAALLGGRRIGKTSLLQGTKRTLDSENWLVFYADLQEAGDWRTFAEYVTLRWGVEVAESFAPASLAAIVAQLRERGPGQLVVMLDEVDNLLRWDYDHGRAHVPEAFFRACRALSQEGSVQFVFSGERIIAERLWEPASPNWNFCRPLPVKQLTREATEQLLVSPLTSLGVTFADRKRALAMVWNRTHGHPQIVQTLGERLVTILNDRAPTDRRHLSSRDIETTTNSDEYRQHYVTTYWGQATNFERLITALVATGASTFEELRPSLEQYGQPVGAEAIRSALRMLDLYGIVESIEEPLAFRAAWMPDAMAAFGGPKRLVADLGN